MWTDDLDLDGTDEVLLCTDAGIFVFKAISEFNYVLLLAVPTPKIEDGGFWSDGGNSYDLDFDGITELFISGQQHLIYNRGRSNAVIYKLDIPSGIESKTSSLLDNYILFQNYPNPFNSSTEIVYEQLEMSKVRITVYNVLGEVLKTLVNEVKPKGIYKINFDAVALPSGVYVITMKAGNYRHSIKSLLLK